MKGGRFIAVGTTADIKGLIGKDTQHVRRPANDGRARLHRLPQSRRRRRRCSTRCWSAIRSKSSSSPSTASSTSCAPRRGRRRRARGWKAIFFDDTKVKDKRELNVHDLDEVSLDHPVVVRHRGGHTSFYNSKALEMAGVTKNTPNPPGGTFDRDANGELNGRVTDHGARRLQPRRHARHFTPAEQEQRDRDGLAHISKQFVRYGLTSVHHEGGDLAALQQVRARGELHHRVSYEASGSVLDSMIAGGIMTGFGDEWIRFGATSEHTVDGSFSERTMALSQPYPGVQPAYKGNVTETQDDLNAWIEKVHRAGIQVNCHANGDVAIDMFLTAVERAQKLFPRPDARPKITHCTLINDDLVRRIKALGAVPAMFTTYAYYNSDKFVFYGEDLMKRSHGVPHLPRCRRARGGRFGFQSRVRSRRSWAFRGWSRARGGTARRGARISGSRVDEALQVNTHQRRVRVKRREHQRVDHRRQAGGLRRARRGSAHGRSGEDQGHPDRPHGRRRSDRCISRNRHSRRLSRRYLFLARRRGHGPTIVSAAWRPLEAPQRLGQPFRMPRNAIDRLPELLQLL